MTKKSPPSKVAGTGQEFIAAFRMVLAHDTDRRMLLELAGAGREIRYEELRKAVHEDSKQLYQYAVDRLIDHVLINRRLEEAGERYRSYLSPTPRGMLVAKILRSLGRRGSLPEELPDQLQAQVREFFAPAVPA